MNKNKLIMIGIILVVLIGIGGLVFFLIGDSGNGGDNINPGTDTGGNESSGATVQLQYWGLWEPEVVMDPIIEKYEAQNPGVKINYVQKSVTQYEENSYARVVQGATTGEPAPDILKINNKWLPKFQDYIEPAPSSVITSADFSDMYYSTVVEDFTGTDGQIYSMPYGIDGLAVFYNKELLAKAGYDKPAEDWNSFIEMAKKLTVTDAGGDIVQGGVGAGTSNNVKHSADILNLLLLQNKVDPYSISTNKVDFSSPQAEAALEFYTDFAAEHQTWSSDLEYDLDLFYSGKLAMFFGPSWRAFDIIQANKELEFGIASVPQLPNNPSVNYSMYWGEVVSKRSKYPLEAWKFIKFMNEPAQAKELYSNSSKIRSFGQPFARKDLKSEVADNPYVSPILEMAPTMESWYMPEQSYIESSLNTAINSAVNGTDPGSALNTSQEEINSKLNSDAVEE